MVTNFNLPVILIMNIFKDYFYNDYLIIITTVFILFLLTLVAVLTFFGPEKKLTVEIFRRIKKLNI